MWWERKSMRRIAEALSRSHTSVSREMRKNFPREHKVYTPRLAQERAETNTHHRGRDERLKNETVRSYVIAHLKRRWSPEQISLRIKIDLKETISHEAIYSTYTIRCIVMDEGISSLDARTCEDASDDGENAAPPKVHAVASEYLGHVAPQLKSERKWSTIEDASEIGRVTRLSRETASQ